MVTNKNIYLCFDNIFKKPKLLNMKKLICLTFLMLIVFTNQSLYAFESISYDVNKNERISQQIEKKKKEKLNLSKIEFSDNVAPVKPNRKKLKENYKTKKRKIAETAPGVALIWVGVSIWAIGLLLMFFISLLLGSILAVIGLAIWVAGIIQFNKAKANGETKSNNTDPGKSSTTYKDVVYLKNGSMVKGIIIEQIPNVSLKIETNDGSVFVYKMEEVEKMAKEK